MECSREPPHASSNNKLTFLDTSVGTVFKDVETTFFHSFLMDFLEFFKCKTWHSLLYK